MPNWSSQDSLLRQTKCMPAHICGGDGRGQWCREEGHEKMLHMCGRAPRVRARRQYVLLQVKGGVAPEEHDVQVRVGHPVLVLYTKPGVSFRFVHFEGIRRALGEH
jgi:hypothetical protein